MLHINENAPVKSTQSILIHANAARVWAVLTDMEAWPKWNTAVAKIKMNGPLQAGTTFDWKVNGATIHSTLHTVMPHSKLGWTGKAFGAYAIHNWELVEADGQTRVTVTESMEGWLVGLLKKMMQKNLDTGNGAWLAQMKAVCEAQ